jgi:hypothetical protein
MISSPSCSNVDAQTGTQLTSSPIALTERVQTVQDEVDKLLSGNEVLQMYIENLAKQIRG